MPTTRSDTAQAFELVDLHHYEYQSELDHTSL